VAARILVVDDDRLFRRLVVRTLCREYEVAEASTGEEALQVCDAFAPAIVLLDIMMPGIDGYETCRRLKASLAGAQAQVMMVSGHSSRQEQLRAYELGADDYLVKPIDVQELRSRVQLHLRMQDALQNVFSIKQEVASRNRECMQLAERRSRDLQTIQDVVVLTLAKVAECRDKDTGGHLHRVRSFCRLLAEELSQNGPYGKQIDAQFLEDLHRASPLHDIGKVAIPDEILLKPGRLTADEFEQMKQHTVLGAKILDQAVAQSPYAGFLEMAAMVARYHHERYDGTGYPAGLAGLEIPLPARIVALVDVYDALTSDRPYKVAEPPNRAREIVQRESGRHFDPAIVDAFVRRFADFVQIRQNQPVAPSLVAGAMSFREYEHLLVGV
jgi:putative two-component system response regulator